MFETLQRVRASLPDEVALIGFCGAPWTVASYMIAGRGTPDQAPARLFAYQNRDLFAEPLIVSAGRDFGCYPIRQLRAGAQAVQIFDSWSGVLPAAELERWCLAPLAAIVAKVRAEAPDAPIIAFPRGAGFALIEVCERWKAIAALGLDTTVEPAWATATHCARSVARRAISISLALVAGGDSLDESVDRIFHGLFKPATVFYLGHGILPETPIAHVARLVNRVRRAPTRIDDWRSPIMLNVPERMEGGKRRAR